MKLRWTSEALADLSRLYEFLAPLNQPAAARAVESLATAPIRLLRHPRMGEMLKGFEPREVRRFLVGKYELRYEIQSSNIYVLRIWHVREDR